jgi:hypothetical protein
MKKKYSKILTNANLHLNQMLEFAGLEVIEDSNIQFSVRKSRNNNVNVGISPKIALAKVIYLYGD